MNDLKDLVRSLSPEEKRQLRDGLAEVRDLLQQQVHDIVLPAVPFKVDLDKGQVPLQLCQ